MWNLSTIISCNVPETRWKARKININYSRSGCLFMRKVREISLGKTFRHLCANLCSRTFCLITTNLKSLRIFDWNPIALKIKLLNHETNWHRDQLRLWFNGSQTKSQLIKFHEICEFLLPPSDAAFIREARSTKSPLKDGRVNCFIDSPLSVSMRWKSFQL